MDDGHGHGPHGDVVPAHGPAEPEPRRLLPERQMLVRGVALGALAIVLMRAGCGAIVRSRVLAPAGIALAGGAVLAAWAAVIHFAGGERFDDHPFI